MKDKEFSYQVTRIQIEQHSKLNLLEVFDWLEETNKFLYSVQKPEERQRLLKGNRSMNID